MGALRDDNRVLLEYAAVSRDNTNEIPAMKNNINEILARVNSIRQGRGSGSTARVEQWMEDIEVLTSYAETTYQGTIVDPDEKGPTGLHQHQEVGMPTINDEQEEGSGSTEDVVTLAPEVSNFGRLSVQEDNEYVPSGTLFLVILLTFCLPSFTRSVNSCFGAYRPASNFAFARK